ncbi:MAG: inverse autotransporter beta domain-containing protein [Candidatus Thioglobus sp.]|uniref:inverse autotransporter beta domain-containing protein n=1 Tax=Candidatus Thioglobus sp. TaxID=2026721 RepID=UPI003096444A
MSNPIKTTVLSAGVTLALGLSFSANAQVVSQVVDSLKNKAINATESYVEKASLKGLNSIYDKVELNIEFNDGSPEFELGALKAYDEANPNAFLFNQIGINRFDSRTTLNLGVGYRMLNADQTWMGGVNAFYDQEFPNDHKRSGMGVELISSAIQLRANTYNGITGYITDKSGTDSKALDGSDVSLKMALPYLPGTFLTYTDTKWKGIDGAKDSKSKQYKLGGALSDNLSLNVVRVDYDEATTKDTNRVQLSYNWNFGNEAKRPTLFNTADTAYQLTQLTTQKYDLVQRENRIVKKKSGVLKVSGY